MTATLALADRLARLERTVATLQQQQPGAEALQPNILTIDPQGNVSVVLQGGVTIPVTATDPPTLAHAVTFERADGTDAGQIYLDDTGGPAIVLKATADPSAPEPATIGARASGSGGSASVLLLEDNGVSSFLQLLSAQQLQLQTGSTSLTWAGTSADGNATVAHGLGRTPILVWVPNLVIPSTRSWQCFAGAYTSANFALLARPDGVYTGTVSFPWAVVG